MSLSLCLVLLAATVRDEAHGFSFDEPKGYERAPKVQSPSLYVFSRGSQAGADFAAISLIELNAPLAQDTKLVPEVVEDAARKEAAQLGIKMTGFDYGKIPWGDYELDVVTSRGEFQGNTFVTLGTQVPLQQKALQVQLAGRDEAALRADLQALIGSLSGTSNWERPSPVKRLGRPLGVVLAVGIGLFVAMRLMRRRRA
jgi:hypothetical protein